MPAPAALPAVPVALTVGDLAGTGLLQVYAGTRDGVTRVDGDGWQTVTDLWAQGYGEGALPLVADLTGDGQPDLAIGPPASDDGAGQVLLFEGPLEVLLDWSSPHQELKSAAGFAAGQALAASDFDGDGALDLVVQGSSIAWVRPGPILASAPLVYQRQWRCPLAGGRWAVLRGPGRGGRPGRRWPRRPDRAGATG